jgi:hypothetical protein
MICADSVRSAGLEKVSVRFQVSGRLSSSTWISAHDAIQTCVVCFGAQRRRLDRRSCTLLHPLEHMRMGARSRWMVSGANGVRLSLLAVVV